MKSSIVSIILLEKPHSLSYQDNTLQNFWLITWVWVKSKIELLELWLKSIDTNGRLLVVKEEGLIDEIKEVEAEEKEEVEETEEVEASKEEVQFVSVEQFNTTIDELKALITELKGNTELSEEEIKEETTELSEEVKEEVQEVELATAKEEVAEPIKHNPENNEKVNVGRKISPKKQNTIMDSVFSKISNKNNNK